MLSERACYEQSTRRPADGDQPAMAVDRVFFEDRTCIPGLVELVGGGR
jgi:hypothetical protein